MHIPAEAIVGFPVIPGEKGNFMVGRNADASLGMISGVPGVTDVGDVCLGPHLPSQLSLRQQTAGILDQILQHCQRAGTQGNGLLPSPQAAVRHIETAWSKGKVVWGLHQDFLNLGLNSI
jgi:hypothetical protein